jgi:purine nucleosidase/pyrimidine-specific ribonucleoside hydrolase
MKKILLDCDPGMDDSAAIIMAAKSKDLELLGVTTVTGNYAVTVTAANARKTLEMIRRTDIPVAQGMARPMVRPAPKDPFTHGEDGQAENFLPGPVMPLSPLHAVEFIIETVKAHPGEVSILATGAVPGAKPASLRRPLILLPAGALMLTVPSLIVWRWVTRLIPAWLRPSAGG